jgi:hypothetical protein
MKQFFYGWTSARPPRDVGASRNAKGLQDALRAINATGGTIEAEWPLERALRIGDPATHGRSLTELYGKMASRPFAVDLNYLWEQLGVGENGPNPKTPWARTRAAICGVTEAKR